MDHSTGTPRGIQLVPAGADSQRTGAEGDAEIDKVTDPGDIVSWGVMSTPALVIDDEVVLSGHISPAKVKGLLAARLAA